MKTLEEMIRESIANELQKESKTIVEKLVSEFRELLEEKSAVVIGKTVSSLVYREQQDIASLGTTIMLSVRK